MKLKFEQIWNQVIVPLEGKVINTLDKNKPNKILKVTDDYLTRDSENNSPTRNISKEIFEAIYYHILENGSISRVEINTALPKRFSSIVCTVFAKAPNIGYKLNPIILNKK